MEVQLLILFMSGTSRAWAEEVFILLLLVVQIKDPPGTLLARDQVGCTWHPHSCGQLGGCSSPPRQLSNEEDRLVHPLGA